MKSENNSSVAAGVLASLSSRSLVVLALATLLAFCLGLWFVVPTFTKYGIKTDHSSGSNPSEESSRAATVRTGKVDLATSTYVLQSKSLSERNGRSEVPRNVKTIRFSGGEKARFRSDSRRVMRLSEIEAPTLISPDNMMLISEMAESNSIEFSWTAVADASGYRLMVSRNQYFSSTLVDYRMNAEDVMVWGLPPGTYYWTVNSYADNGEQIGSETNRFSIILQGKDGASLNPETVQNARGGVKTAREEVVTQ